MHIHIETIDDGIIVATPQGSVDCSSADTFGEKFLPLFDQARTVILDGSQLSFITSAGLRVLLTAQQKSTPPKRFILCARLTITSVTSSESPASMPCSSMPTTKNKPYNSSKPHKLR